MTFLLLALLVGIGLFMFGIWMMFHLQAKDQSVSSMISKKCILYRKKLYTAICLSIAGFTMVWSVAAASVNVVHTTFMEVLDSSPGRLVVELGIFKQRGCKLTSLLIKSVHSENYIDYAVLDSPALITNSAEGYSPDFIIVEVNRDNDFVVKRVDFSATYQCPFGFEVTSHVGSLIPDTVFNVTIP